MSKGCCLIIKKKTERERAHERKKERERELEGGKRREKERRDKIDR